MNKITVAILALFVAILAYLTWAALSEPRPPWPPGGYVVAPADPGPCWTVPCAYVAEGTPGRCLLISATRSGEAVQRDGQWRLEDVCVLPGDREAIR
jgi:hypothetical protein